MSLWSGKEPAFHDENGDYGMSELMRHFMAGLIEYAPDYTWFLAPYVNSYKRFMKGTFAPTKRGLVGRQPHSRFPAVRRADTKGGARRMPHRRFGHEPLSGAQAALLAAGIKGIEDKLELAPPTAGDIYENAKVPDIPSHPARGDGDLRNSKMLREAMGDDVVDHYTRCAEWEQEEFDKAVTDWEIARGFERA
jgi:glutamine synthetase